MDTGLRNSRESGSWAFALSVLLLVLFATPPLVAQEGDSSNPSESVDQKEENTDEGGQQKGETSGGEGSTEGEEKSDEQENQKAEKAASEEDSQEESDDPKQSEQKAEEEEKAEKDGGEKEAEKKKDKKKKKEFKTVQLTPKQKRLNNKAIKALQAKSPKPGAAIRYLNAALLVGPKANLLYMALGRAYQLQGKCKQATEAFHNATVAPQAKSIPRIKVMARIEKYRGDLESTCPGFLTVKCTPSDQVELSMENRSISCGERTKLPSGSHKIVAEYGDVPPRRRTVEIVSMKSKKIHIQFERIGPVQWASNRTASAVDKARTAQVDAYGKAATEQQVQTAESVAGMLGSWFAVRAESAATKVKAARQKAKAEKRRKKQKKKMAKAREEADDDDDDDDDDGREGGFQVTVRAQALTGGYMIQAEDGAVDGGINYGGSGILSLGYFFQPRWAIENQAQFDWIESSPLGIKSKQGLGKPGAQKIDVRTWRYRNTLIGWLDRFGLGGFVDYRHHEMTMGPDDNERTHDTDTLVGGPAVILSSSLAFAPSGHFRLFGRWGPLFDGSSDSYQIGISVVPKYFELSFEYETLTGEHSPKKALRSGELFMIKLGARVPLLASN